MRNVICIFIYFSFLHLLSADTVELRSGKIFENVKAKVLKEKVLFAWEGKQLTFAKNLVRKIKLRSVVLKPPVTATEKLEVESERVRVAETFQSASEWEIDPDSKPIVAVVQFRAGRGVSLAEAESVTNLILTGLVKSKLFTVMDVSSISKSCTEDEIDCANRIKAKMKVNKIVAGTITRLGDSYLLNGYVVDEKNNSIDFAEKSSADSIVQLEGTSEYFSKKIAGGMMEYWDEAMTAKDNEVFKNLKYVWRSTLLPGLGQWKYGEDQNEKFSKFKGYAIGAITVALVVNLNSQESAKIQKRNQYENSFTLFLLTPNGDGIEGLGFLSQQNKFQDYENATETTKLSATGLIGFYFINILDSFFQGKYYLPTKPKSANLFFIPSKSMSYGIKEEVYSMGVQYQF